jgi:hypothetical protein
VKIHFIQVTLALTLAFAGATAIAKPVQQSVEVCETRVPALKVDGTSQDVTTRGLCIKDRAGHPVKWVVEPMFVTLQYAKDSKIFYGWKWNDPSGTNKGQGSPEDAKKYGVTSSVIFNADGTRRAEIAGEIYAFSNGLGSFATGSDFTLIGISIADTYTSPVLRTLFVGLYGVDFFLSYLGEWVSDGLLLDAPPYRSWEENTWRQKRRGFVDEQGRVVIEPTFSACALRASFESRYAIVTDDQCKYGLIDKNGTAVLAMGFQDIALTKYQKQPAYRTLSSECGWISCKKTMKYLHPTSLDVLSSSEGTYYKYRLMRTLQSDAHKLGQVESTTRLGIAVWLAGILFMWPICVMYQRLKKRKSYGLAVRNGLGWACVTSAGVMLFTFAVLFLFVFVFMAMNIFATLAASDKSD